MERNGLGSRWMRRTRAWLVVSLIGTMVGGCNVVRAMREEMTDEQERREKKEKRDKKEHDDAPTQLSAPAHQLAPVPTADPQYFKDATDIPRKFKEKVGCAPCRALQVSVYPGFAMSQLQDPKVPLNADSFTLRDGVVGDVQPIQFMGPKPTIEGLKRQTFDLEADVDWGKLPAMIESTPITLKIEGAVVSHAIIKRDLPFSDTMSVRVYASGPRRNGSVQFDGKGNVLKVFD